MQFKDNYLNKKTRDTYLHPIETIIKTIVLYTYENWGNCTKKRKYKEEQLHVRLVRKTTCNIKVVVHLGRPLFKIYIETQMFKYLQCLLFLEENTYLRKAINEEIKITNLERITNLKYISDSYGLSNLMINIFKVVEGDISKKDCKNKQNFFQTRDKDSFTQENFFTYASKNIYIFTQTKDDQYKKETSMNLKSYDNRVAITKLKASLHNMAINTAKKWYKLPDDQKICKCCQRNNMENELQLVTLN